MPKKSIASLGTGASSESLLKAERLAKRYLSSSENLHARRRESSGEREKSTASHLWEHSLLVAGLARRLAEIEGTDSGPAYLAGLFHDAGKFAGGRYHQGKRSEESASAAAAARLLRDSGVERRTVGLVVQALRSLYREGAKPDKLADIVHDADFLAKSGRLGVAQFFIKSTLRGQDLTGMVTGSLSRELTYAASLARNMRTAAGRKLAAAKAAGTTRYFRGLIRELEQARGQHYEIRRLRVVPGRKPGSGRAGGAVPVLAVLPRRCDRCGGVWRLDVSTDPGVKCEKLELAAVCADCGRVLRTSFCLPELISF